jgi:endonuclease/exonuclease/phosphatase family metal-dependent hydrolase
MRVLTWNILHPDSDDKRNRDATRISKILDRIKGYHPDVVCLQEADSAQMEEYIEVFSEYHVVWQDDKTRKKKLDKWRKEGGQKPHTMVCATLIKKPIEIVEYAVASRSLTVKIRLENGIELVVTNVHLESGRNVDAIHVKHLTKLVHSDVLCGDFNDFIGEPAIDFVKEKGYISVYAKSRPEFTFHDSNRKMLIDFIFYMPKLKIEHVQWEKDTVYSDHVPVIADLRDR